MRKQIIDTITLLGKIGEEFQHHNVQINASGWDNDGNLCQLTIRVIHPSVGEFAHSFTITEILDYVGNPYEYICMSLKMKQLQILKDIVLSKVKHHDMIFEEFPYGDGYLRGEFRCKHCGRYACYTNNPNTVRAFTGDAINEACLKNT